MSFTSNTRDEITLIFLKHKFRANEEIVRDRSAVWDVRRVAAAENYAIRATFLEVRERNAQDLQPGTYEAIGQICDEFFAAAEPAQVG